MYRDLVQNNIYSFFCSSARATPPLPVPDSFFVVTTVLDQVQKLFRNLCGFQTWSRIACLSSQTEAFYRSTLHH
jgi:hypothetical protein